MYSQAKSTLAKLLKFAGNYKYLIIIACFFSALSSILSLFPFIAIWFAIRDIFAVLPNLTQATGTLKYGWLAMGSAVLSIIFYYISLLSSHLAAFRVEKNMRQQAMHKLISLPLGFFKQNNSGKLRKIIDDNSSLTHGFLAHQLSDFAGAVIMPLAIVAVLFLVDWRLGMVCLIPLVVSLLFLKQMMAENTAEFMNKYLDALEDLNSAAVEYVRGIPIVKVFQQNVYSFKDLHNSIKRYQDFASEFALSCRIPMLNFSLAINAPSLLLIPVGLLLILNTSNYQSFLLDLIFYLLFAPICVTMMTKIMSASENIMVAREAINRIENLMQTNTLLEEKTKKQTNRNDIKFENVIFSYPNSSKPVINKLSFNIPAGKTFALVGPSGGGKSTLASLIPRFWDVDSGQIKIGGIDVKSFAEEDLMSKIAFVFQDNKLFKGSIKENITMGKPTATHKEIKRAIQLAQCSDIIAKMPAGLDTILGTAGVYLSGGEQQRITLARAILKDAPIVILDEATAFADPENEYQIQQAFEALVKDKTVLMIAHRLSSIKNVDSILVIQAGQLVEQGTHNELLQKDGIYKTMWQEYQTSIAWQVGEEKKYA